MRFFAPSTPVAMLIGNNCDFCVGDQPFATFSTDFNMAKGAGGGGRIAQKPYFLEWLNNFATDCCHLPFENKELNSILHGSGPLGSGPISSWSDFSPTRLVRQYR